MTENELLGLFRAVASVRVTPGMLSPGALAWVEHQLELAAARGAGDSRIPDAATATHFAESFFSIVIQGAQAQLGPEKFGVVGNPTINPDTLSVALASFGFWPFVRG